MLAADALQTPRPRPPAQLRRSTSKGFALNEGAPPPYAFEFPSLHEGADGDTSDPVVATARMMGIELDDELELSPTIVTDVSRKSREELTNLVLQAEKIIKARETELLLAANLGKTLLETNEALKLRHDALVSRLPVMQSQPSTLASSSKSTPKPKLSQGDPWTTDEDIPASTPCSHTGSIIGSACDSPTHSRTSSVVNSLAHRGHARRISASPSALLALSETNAELIAELTRLRSSTDSAQIEGGRRLRKLEREIGGLKAELDATQRTNAELEERVKDQQDEERKREREERMKRLRAVEYADSDDEVKDFAPQGQGVDTWDSVGTPRMTRKAPQSTERHFISDSEMDNPPSAYDGSVSSVASSRAGSQSSIMSPGEFAVVSQLYRKVEELQEANKELGVCNRTMNERLARAKRDALEIKRVYDEIGEEIDAEVDVGQGIGGEGWRGTIKDVVTPTGSLRSPRSARSVTPRASSWAFRSNNGQAFTPPMSPETPTKKSRLGTRARGNKHMYGGTRTLKSRKPLTNTLFAPPSTHNVGLTPSIVVVPSRSPHSRTKVKGKFKAKSQALLSRSSSPFDSLALRRDFSDSSCASSRARSASASSFLSTSSYASLTRYAGRRRGRRSLGSELGDEFGADWGASLDMSRHNTLFDGESLRDENHFYGQCDAEYEEELEQEDPALAALRDAFSPPNAGRLLDIDEHILPVGALRASPGEAFQLVSHAVGVRPNRWLDSDDRRIRGPGPHGAIINSTFFSPHGAEAEDPWETTRYPDIEPGEDVGDNVHMRTCRRERALERMASTRRASHGENPLELVPSASQVLTVDCQPCRRRHVVDTIKRTSTDALIELWIFLQFVVVICTFLYTTARRGPREILGVSPRRA